MRRMSNRIENGSCDIGNMHKVVGSGDNSGIFKRVKNNAKGSVAQMADLINNIEVVLGQSLFCKVEHPIIVIDGIPLDALLHNHYPSRNLAGLIPVMPDWLDDPGERAFILSRYNCNSNEFVMPVLMCPDDCDLSCTVVVAHVVRTGNRVAWKKLGINMNSRVDLLSGYDHIGNTVDWLDKIPELTFTEPDYTSQFSKIYRLNGCSSDKRE